MELFFDYEKVLLSIPIIHQVDQVEVEKNQNPNEELENQLRSLLFIFQKRIMNFQFDVVRIHLIRVQMLD